MWLAFASTLIGEDWCKMFSQPTTIMNNPIEIEIDEKKKNEKRRDTRNDCGRIRTLL